MSIVLCSDYEKRRCKFHCFHKTSRNFKNYLLGKYFFSVIYKVWKWNKIAVTLLSLIINLLFIMSVRIVFTVVALVLLSTRVRVCMYKCSCDVFSNSKRTRCVEIYWIRPESAISRRLYIINTQSLRHENKCAICVDPWPLHHFSFPLRGWSPWNLKGNFVPTISLPIG